MAVQTNKTYVLGNFELEPDKRQLLRDGLPVHLANRPFQVLVYLVENRQRLGFELLYSRAILVRGT